jgi:hypothetical protein
VFKSRFAMKSKLFLTPEEEPAELNPRVDCEIFGLLASQVRGDEQSGLGFQQTPDNDRPIRGLPVRSNCREHRAVPRRIAAGRP